MTPTPTFFWHDYETFGAVPRRDRPAQFAGIRTDRSLTIIGEPVMWYCQPALECLPDPISCLITGILPQDCLKQGLPEHEFATRIHQVLATPNTIGVGYNTIRFDDEVTRYLLWRNLIDPYAREWQNNCGRWDILDMVRAAYALRPDGINWPINSSGQVSFRLEDLTLANDIKHIGAHDALVDVRATIELAKKILQHHPKLFEFCLRLHKKQAVIQEIGEHKPFIHISGMYPTERGCLAIVWPLAPHPSNPNELIVWDLSYDPTELGSMNASIIRERLFTKKEALPEGVNRLPIKTIHLNKSPIVIGNLNVLSLTRAEQLGIDKELIQKHIYIAQKLTNSLYGLWPDVFARPDEQQSGPYLSEQRLYDGFVSKTDRLQLEAFRKLSLPDQVNRLDNLLFEDERLHDLVFQYCARHSYDLLTPAQQQLWQKRHTSFLTGQYAAISESPLQSDSAPNPISLKYFNQKIQELKLSAQWSLPQHQHILDQLLEWGHFVAAK